MENRFAPALASHSRSQRRETPRQEGAKPELISSAVGDAQRSEARRRIPTTTAAASHRLAPRWLVYLPKLRFNVRCEPNTQAALSRPASQSSSAGFGGGQASLVLSAKDR